MRAQTLRSLISVFTTVSILALAGTAHADDIYMSATGVRLGAFKADSARVAGKIDVTGFTYGVASPRDAVTGQSTGRRQHKPVHVVKPISAASPQFFQALVTNEVLSSVVIDFVATNPALKEGGRLNYSVRLTGARVSNVEQFTETDASGVTRLMEAVDLTFQTIELTHAPSQTVATDSFTPAS